MDKYIEKAFSFSKKHKKLMENDSRYISGWRYDPSILFERGQGVKIIDVDDNECSILLFVNCSLCNLLAIIFLILNIYL